MLSATLATPPGKIVLVILSSLVKRFGISRMRDFSYGQDVLGNAVSKVLQIFQEEARITNAPAQQTLNVILKNIYETRFAILSFNIQDFDILDIF